MNQIFNIGKMADFFQIHASALRYWEEAGLITPVKNNENDYREYSVDDLMTVSDILFYKNLGLPLKQIHEIEKTDVSGHQKLLEEKMGELKQQKKEIDRRIQKLQYHLNAISALHDLEDHPFKITDIDTECIVPFELIEIDKLKKYIDDPYLYSRVQHSSQPQQERRGLTVSLQEVNKIPKEQILWKKTETKYVTCLMKEEIAAGYPNNLLSLLETVQEKYRTGYIISRFLLCAQENGKTYDFYKTYIEIL
ncbi:MAG: MerR family transcriptional regulator [Clostridiales bacterium]|nr:MerR family transcriptional regulator [Clostridiales bacterium]